MPDKITVGDVLEDIKKIITSKEPAKVFDDEVTARLKQSEYYIKSTTVIEGQNNGSSNKKPVSR